MSSNKRNGLSCSEAGKLGHEKSRKALAKYNKARRKEAVEKYESSPVPCKRCNLILPFEKRFNKFCSKSCSASHNNKGQRRHGYPPRLYQCLNCGDDIEDRVVRKFCSNACDGQYKRKQTYERIKNGLYNSPYPSKAVKEYLVDKRGRSCEGCGRKTWMGKPVPLNVHHVDGDATNNLPSNLELLCLNCHGLTDTFGSKNGNGTRTYRYNKQAG